jgi:hypothetical protein
LPSPTRQLRKHSWEGFRSGEELFGLPVTQYLELEKTEEEIVMLDKLYRWAVPQRYHISCRPVQAAGWEGSVPLLRERHVVWQMC